MSNRKCLDDGETSTRTPNFSIKFQPPRLDVLYSTVTMSKRIRIFTAEDVAGHASLSTCWVSRNGKVYDVTAFLADHPGGDDLILNHAGKDIGAVMQDPKEHDHSDSAYDMLEEYIIGRLGKGESIVSDGKCSICMIPCVCLDKCRLGCRGWLWAWEHGYSRWLREESVSRPQQATSPPSLGSQLQQVLLSSTSSPAAPPAWSCASVWSRLSRDFHPHFMVCSAQHLATHHCLHIYPLYTAIHFGEQCIASLLCWPDYAVHTTGYCPYPTFCRNEDHGMLSLWQFRMDPPRVYIPPVLVPRWLLPSGSPGWVDTSLPIARDSPLHAHGQVCTYIGRNNVNIKQHFIGWD